MNASGASGRHAQAGVLAWRAATVNAHQQSGRVVLVKPSACVTPPMVNVISNFAQLQHLQISVNNVFVIRALLEAAFYVLLVGRGIPAQTSVAPTVLQLAKSANVSPCGAMPPAQYLAPRQLFKMGPMPMDQPSWCPSYVEDRAFVRMVA